VLYIPPIIRSISLIELIEFGNRRRPFTLHFCWHASLVYVISSVNRESDEANLTFHVRIFPGDNCTKEDRVLRRCGWPLAAAR